MFHDNAGSHGVSHVLSHQEVQVVACHGETKQDGRQEHDVLPPVPVVLRSVSQCVMEAMQRRLTSEVFHQLPHATLLSGGATLYFHFLNGSMYL